jgi:hypothetical protein
VLNCKETAKLVSQSHDRRLSLYERLQVRMHLAMCILCRNFSKQLNFIRRLTRSMGESGPESLIAEGAVFDESLSPEAKSRIKDVLAKEK